MMISPTAGGRPKITYPHRQHTLAPDRRRQPQEGVERVTRSKATSRAQVSSSTTELVWWWVACLMRPLALWKPLRGHLLSQHEPS